MHRGIFVAGEADESRLALPLGFVEGFEHAALGVGKLGIVVEADAVDLPEIKMVGAEPGERLLEHLHCDFGTAAMRADFGH